MRKRILAICLSAALLLGLLPVLSAPSSAAEENAMVTEFDLVSTNPFNDGARGFSAAGSDAYGRASFASTTSSSAFVSHTMEFDHSKNILFEQTIQVQDGRLPVIDASSALTPSGGVNAHEGYQIIISTGMTAFCANLFNTAEGLKLCVATATGTEVVDLGASTGTYSAAAFTLAILWGADDSATISVNGSEKAKVMNASVATYTGIGTGSRMRLRLNCTTADAGILTSSLKITQSTPGESEEPGQEVLVKEFDVTDSSSFTNAVGGYNVISETPKWRAQLTMSNETRVLVSYNCDDTMPLDHSKDILFEQELYVPVGGMPVVSESAALTASTYEGYEMLLVNGKEAIHACLFVADSTGNLKLSVRCADGTFQIVDLGKTTSNSTGRFKLGILWGADDSVTVKVADLVENNASSGGEDVFGAYAEKAYIENATGDYSTGNKMMRLRLYSSSTNAYMYLCSNITITESPVVEEPEWTVSQQAVLGEDIALDLHISMPERLNAEDYKVLVGVGESTTEQPLSDLPEKDGKYVATASMAAAQMNDTVTLKITDAGGEEVFANTYTVRDYALDIINGTYGEYDEATIALVQAMLDYGGKAQAYFNYNASNPANDGISVINQEIPSADAYATQVNGSLEGIQVKGVTLLFQSETVIRYYFTACEGFTFTVDGKEYTEVKKNATGYYVDVTVDNPSLMAQAYTVSVTDGDENEMSVSYSCLHYIVRMYHKDTTSQTLKDLLQAMYNYYMAAKDYPG